MPNNTTVRVPTPRNLWFTAEEAAMLVDPSAERITFLTGAIGGGGGGGWRNLNSGRVDEYFTGLEAVSRLGATEQEYTLTRAKKEFNKYLKDKFGFNVSKDVMQPDSPINKADYILALRHWYYYHIFPAQDNCNKYLDFYKSTMFQSGLFKCQNTLPKGRSAIFTPPKPIETPTPQSVRRRVHSLLEFLLYCDYIRHTRGHIWGEIYNRAIHENFCYATEKSKIIFTGTKEECIEKRRRLELIIQDRFSKSWMRLQCEISTRLGEYVLSITATNKVISDSLRRVSGFTVKHINVYGKRIPLIHPTKCLNNNAYYASSYFPINIDSFLYGERHLNQSRKTAFACNIMDESLGSPQDYLSSALFKPNIFTFLRDRKTYVLDFDKVLNHFNEIGKDRRDTLRYTFSVPRFIWVYGSSVFKMDRQNFYFLRNEKNAKDLLKKSGNVQSAVWCAKQNIWVLPQESLKAVDETLVPKCKLFRTPGQVDDIKYCFGVTRCSEIATGTDASTLPIIPVEWGEESLGTFSNDILSGIEKGQYVIVYRFNPTETTGNQNQQPDGNTTRPNNTIREYNFNVLRVHKPNEEGVDPVKKRYFGIEMEFTIKRGRYQEFHEDIPFIESKTFICKHDGSISGEGNRGVEIVSAPSSIPTLKSEIQRILEHENGVIGYNNTCGIHIHVSRESVREYVVASLKEFFADKRNQTFLDRVSGRSENSYCRRKNDKVFKELLISPETGLEIKVPSDTEKYRAINAMKDKTIEFRCFAGSTDLNTITMNLEFCDAILDYLDNLTNDTIKQREDRLHCLNFVKWVLDKRNIKTFEKKWPILVTFLKVMSSGLNLNVIK